MRPIRCSRPEKSKRRRPYIIPSLSKANTNWERGLKSYIYYNSDLQNIIFVHSFDSIRVCLDSRNINILAFTIYKSSEELWVGKGYGYATWRAGSDRTIDTNKRDSVDTVAEDVVVNFSNGKFVSSTDTEIRVFDLSGMQLANEGLGSGTYIVIVGGKAHKMAVR